MGRIRTIKPEFPQSETIGRLSRDGRLFFIQLWTICDDSGRARGNSRILASLLYPYDDDAKDLVPVWLAELEAAGVIRCYLVGGDSYVEVPNWLKHQKIDKPTPSKLPPYIEGSPKPRESSTTDMDMDPTKDLGPRTVDQERSILASAPRETPEEYREHWLTIQAKYPNTPTRVNWILAEHAALRLVEAGKATWSYLESQVSAYAAYCRATLRSVAPPERFFDEDGKDRWAGDWTVPKREREARGGLTESAKHWGEDDPPLKAAHAGH